MYLKGYVSVVACFLLFHFGCLLKMHAHLETANKMSGRANIIDRIVVGKDIIRLKPRRFTSRQDFANVLKELKICGWNNAVIFSSAEYISSKIADVMIELFSSDSVSVIRYSQTNSTTSSEWIKAKFWYFYNTRRLRNFVWLGEDLSRIISITNDVFEREKRGLGALLPHDLSILTVTWAEEFSSLQKAMENAILDNIALIVLNESSLSFDAVYTLMWRENKRRESERLVNTAFSHNSVHKAVCEIFPNKNHGMNGRTLVVFTKEWLPFLYKELDPISGKLRYMGFIVGLIDALAKNLNFTYELIPQPGDDDNLTWHDFRVSVANSKVDFGASFYAINSQTYYNHSVTVPVWHLNITGMYVNSEKDDGLNILNVFQREVYCCIVGALVVVIALYEVENRLSSIYCTPVAVDDRRLKLPNHEDSRHPSKHSNSKSQIPLTHFQQESTISLHQGLPFLGHDTPVLVNTKNDTTSHICTGKFKVDPVDHDPIHIVERCQAGTDILFQFIGSIFNQGCLPSPSRGATRILVWSWCLMFIVLGTTFTGNLTADLVSQKDKLPFNTYEEMMTEENFRWGMPDVITLMAVMQRAKSGTLFRKLYDGMMDFAQEDPSVVEGREEQFSNIKSGRYVGFLQDSDLVVYYIKNKPIPNLVVMKETLMTTSLGFILPKFSALNELFSRGLVEVIDYGILDLLSRQMNAKFHYSSERDEVKRSYDLSYLSSLFYLCGTIVAVAVALLAGECLFTHWRMIVNLLTCRRRNMT